MITQMQKAEALRRLHARGGAFVIPNPWDVGSTRLLAQAGFSALATTGSGLAFSRGEPNAAPGREAILKNAAEIVAATDLPVSADLENCFAAEPEVAAETVRAAIAVGLAGGSIEDASYRDDRPPIFDFAHSLERVKAAVAVVRSQPVPFQLVARAENFLYGRRDLADTIKRLQAFREAGADVLYPPGLSTREEVRTVVREVAAPINIVMGLVPTEFTTVQELADLGVARISLGSTLARRAYGALMDAAREMTRGTFAFADAAIPYGEINGAFAKAQPRRAA